MQTALVPDHRMPTPYPQPSLLPVVAPPPAEHWAGRLNGQLDALLKQAPASGPELSPAMADDVQIEPPGLFLGLRAALLFNVALGVTGFVAYEIWTAVCH